MIYVVASRHPGSETGKVLSRRISVFPIPAADWKNGGACLPHLGSISVRRWWLFQQLGKHIQGCRVEGCLALVKALASTLSFWRKREVLGNYLVPHGETKLRRGFSFLKGFGSYFANWNDRRKTCPIPMKFVNLERVWKVHQTLNSTDGSAPVFKLKMSFSAHSACHQISPAWPGCITLCQSS